MTVTDILTLSKAATIESVNEEAFTMDKMREALSKVLKHECSPISNMKFMHGKGRDDDAERLSAIIGVPVIMSPYVPDGMMIGISSSYRIGESPQIVVVKEETK